MDFWSLRYFNRIESNSFALVLCSIRLANWSLWYSRVNPNFKEKNRYFVKLSTLSLLCFSAVIFVNLLRWINTYRRNMMYFTWGKKPNLLLHWLSQEWKHLTTYFMRMMAETKLAMNPVKAMTHLTTPSIQKVKISMRWRPSGPYWNTQLFCLIVISLQRVADALQQCFSAFFVSRHPYWSITIFCGTPIWRNGPKVYWYTITSGSPSTSPLHPGWNHCFRNWVNFMCISSTLTSEGLGYTRSIFLW